MKTKSSSKILGCTAWIFTLWFLSPNAPANVVGVDTQNFNPTSNGLDFVTVQSSETLDQGVLNLGLFANHAVNTLPRFPTDEKSPSKRETFKDSLTGLDLNVGYGVLRGWDIGLSVPQIVSQSVKGDEFRGQFGENGITGVRLNTKLRLLGNKRGGIALVATWNHNLIRDNPWTGIDAGPEFIGELAADTTVGNVALGINLGYRSRTPGKEIPNVPVVPLDDQYLASAAASILIKSISSKLIGEVWMSRPSQPKDTRSDRLNSSSEAIVGLKHDATPDLAIHGGAGTELVHGIASPDIRVYAGLNYTFKPGPEKKPIAKKRRTKKAKPDPVEDFKGADEELSDLPTENPFAGEPVIGVETIVIDDVHFAFDKDNIVLPGTRNILRQLHEYLMKEPRYTHLSIEGHTDYMGSDAYNQDLSERRARTIRRYMIEVHKLPAETVEAWGFGESKPIADNGNWQGRQENRRVEFKITR